MRYTIKAGAAVILSLCLFAVFFAACGKDTQERENSVLLIKDIRAAAEETYLHKKVKLTAKVYRKEEEYAILNDGILSNSAFVHAAMSENDLNALEMGQVITIEGRIDEIKQASSNGIAIEMSSAKCIRNIFRVSGKIQRVIDQEIGGEPVYYCILFDENSILGEGEILVDLRNSDREYKAGDMVTVEGAALSVFREGYIVTARPGPTVYLDEPVFISEE